MMLPTLSGDTAEQLLQNYVTGSRSRWAVLKASGERLTDYLQGQITQDIRRLTAEQGIHACLLSPQGKAVSELYIIQGHGDELILMTPADKAEATVARLRQFAIGYALRIGIVETLSICTVQGTHAHDLLDLFGLGEPAESWLASSRHDREECFAVVMPQTPRGYWIVAPKAVIEAKLADQPQADESEMEAMRIIRGFPDFGVEWDESIHPLNANLAEFDGVAFDKGCYVGQEVTSRMNWRGGIKKKLYSVLLAGTPDAIPCPLLRDGNKIGELKSAAIDHEGRCRGIAWLPIEIAEQQPELTLENDSAVQLLEACHA